MDVSLLHTRQVPSGDLKGWLARPASKGAPAREVLELVTCAVWVLAFPDTVPKWNLPEPSRAPEPRNQQGTDQEPVSGQGLPGELLVRGVAGGQALLCLWRRQGLCSGRPRTGPVFLPPASGFVSCSRSSTRETPSVETWLPREWVSRRKGPGGSPAYCVGWHLSRGRRTDSALAQRPQHVLLFGVVSLGWLLPRWEVRTKR